MSLRQRLLDSTARRPGGLIGRRAYGGELGAPPEHEGVFDRVLERLGPLTGERVLEIGFGGGRLLERILAGGAARAAGLDHSPDMLALAIARNREPMLAGKLDLRLGDASRLPWPAGSFSTVVSANAFFFFEQPERVLDEAHRVLSPGGRLAIATTPGPLPRPSPRMWWVLVWGRALRVYTDDEMRAMCERAGFADVEVESGAGLQLVAAARPGG
jgi:SAM-dependent methyltransferase